MKLDLNISGLSRAINPAVRMLFCFLVCIMFCVNTGSAQTLTGKLAYSKVIIYREKMVHYPSHEYIFPYVIKATDHIPNALGTYYLYYAPHDAPGGICMAYSNSISGPFTEYSGNPILTNKHQGKFDVSHVSSPQVVWMPQYNKYFMYFHGENTATRWAHSTDGVTWDVADDNVALRAANWGTDFTECSYAKVYEYTIPRFGDRYTMVMMLIRSGFGRRIGLATSNDGKHFTPRDEALISQGPGEGSDISGPAYWFNGGRHKIVYHGSSGNIYSTEVGADFNLENHLGVFYNPDASYPEYDKATDPCLFYAEGRWNMFYTVGPRLDQTIAYAFEVPSHDIIVDNTSASFTSSGSWTASTSTVGYFGSNYLSDNNSGTNSGQWAKWKPSFPVAGYYKVMARWPAGSNRPDNIRYRIYHQGVVNDVLKNQQDDNGSWVYLGRYYFDAGTSENNRLTLDAGSDAGYAIADAARFIYDGTAAGGGAEFTSLEDEAAEVEHRSQSVSVYPNSVDRTLKIASDEDLNGAEATVTQMNGVLMKQAKLKNNELDVSSLTTGMYLLTLKHKGVITQLRFSKQ
jgi:hypothetical protein